MYIGLSCIVSIWNDNVIDVSLPITVEYVVADTAPNFKGKSCTHVLYYLYYMNTTIYYCYITPHMLYMCSLSAALYCQVRTNLSIHTLHPCTLYYTPMYR